MIWAAIVFFVLLGIALIVWSAPVAHAQGLVFGGRMPPGCAVIEGILLIVLAAVFYAFLRD